MKGKHVVARRDAVLDRSSTLLTSTKKFGLRQAFFCMKNLLMVNAVRIVIASVQTTCHGERPCAAWPSWFLSLRA